MKIKPSRRERMPTALLVMSPGKNISLLRYSIRFPARVPILIIIINLISTAIMKIEYCQISYKVIL